MFSKIFNCQTKTVTLAAILLAVSALISRFLGLIRDRLLVTTFGAGQELDVYFAAFRIPDFVYGILIMGGVAAVFLPVFSEYFKKEEEEAWRFTSNLLNCFLVLLILVCGTLALFAPLLVSLITPGFSSENKELTAALTRIMFISPIFFGLSSIFSGVLHYFNRFFSYALAPVLYNLGIIFGILFFVPVFGLYGLAFGVILGAFLHWLIQLPSAKSSGFKYLPILNFKNFGLVRVFKLMVPRIIGSAAYNINLIVITGIASFLAAGSIAIFNLANNLQYFPIGLIGISFSVVAFPVLAKKWAAGLKEEFLNVFSLTFRQILFLIVPLSLLIFILRNQIVRIVLGTGQLGWWETRLIAACLGIFCLGIFAAAFAPFLTKVFYSFQDTRTPVVIGLVSMGLNILLCFLFVFLLDFPNFFKETTISILGLEGIEEIRVVGLPLALSISAIIQFSLLLVFLKKKMIRIQGQEILSSLKKILIASGLMVVFTYFSLFFSGSFLETKTFSGIFIQTATLFLFGASSYFLISILLKSKEAGSFYLWKK